MVIETSADNREKGLPELGFHHTRDAAEDLWEVYKASGEPILIRLGEHPGLLEFKKGHEIAEGTPDSVILATLNFIESDNEWDFLIGREKTFMVGVAQKLHFGLKNVTWYDPNEFNAFFRVDSSEDKNADLLVKTVVGAGLKSCNLPVNSPEQTSC